MKLRVPFACQERCPLCAGMVLPASPPLPDEKVQEMLGHAEQTGHGRVYLQGVDVASSPHLAALIAWAKRGGLRVALLEEGAGRELAQRARALREMSVTHVYLPLFRGAPVTSADGLTRRQLQNDTVEVLLALAQQHAPIVTGVHLPITPHFGRELQSVLRLRQRIGLHELLISDTSDDAAWWSAIDRDAIATAVDRAWRAASARNLRLRLLGFERARYAHPSMGEPAPWWDDALLDVVRQGIPVGSARGGIRALAVPDERSPERRIVGSVREVRALGLELAARQCPFIDVPPCLGGTQLAPGDAAAGPAPDYVKSEACPTCPLDTQCPGARDGVHGVRASSLRVALRPLPGWYARKQPRVLILCAEGQDPILYISTLPALCEALRQRGVLVEIVSPWLSRWDPRSTSRVSGYRPDWQGTSGIEAWLQENDLAKFDLVITPDLPTARLALDGGSLHPEARLVFVDFHMLRDMGVALSRWLPAGARAGEGGWWPSHQLVVESAFPRYVQLYINYGVPLEHVTWRPFALYPGHFPAGPEVSGCRLIFSGGNHLRDLDTLRAASERLPATVRPIDLYAPGERFAGNDHLRHRGFVGLADFHHALANSRFVVMPLLDEPNRAAGITVLAMALMAGRALVVTDVGGIRDYVEHDVEALLVPPGDPAALADAIARLDTDPALLARLSAAARAAGHRLSTDHWAEQIVTGAPLIPVRTPHGWRNW